MPTYADKATLLRALTALHEQVIDGEETARLFGGAILIRELTARQRQQANDAALAEDPDQPDNDLYRAMLLQQSVVDPASGQPYADGRCGEDGNPLIDPRTRAPLFTIADVLLLADGRHSRVSTLVDVIMTLSALGPAPLFRSGDAANSGERDAGAGASPLGDTPSGDADPRSGDADERDALPDAPGGATGTPAGGDLVE